MARLLFLCQLLRVLDACAVHVQDAGEADAAGDSATTDSESVSDIQLVRGGGEQRTLFKLTLQVRPRKAGGCQYKVLQ
jgi:hypothetical protein